MVRRSSAVVFVWFLLASPALAQPEVVASVKAELVARGVSLVDSCGGFQITKRVAWRLRATGAGLLSKPSGNQCDGYAVDIIAYADGRIVDILTDAGLPVLKTGTHIVPIIVGDARACKAARRCARRAWRAMS